MIAMWTLLEIIGVLVCAFGLLYTVLPSFMLDCDVTTFLVQIFGNPIDSLADQVIWIIGASGDIGSELIKTLAQHGVRLVISARNVNNLHKLRRELIQTGCCSENNILVLPIDILVIEDHQKHLDKIEQHFGRLDVLVSNFGNTHRPEFRNNNIVEHDVFELNVFSVVSLARTVVRYFIKNSIRGHICVTSSASALIGVPNHVIGNAAKLCLHGYLKCLEAEHPQLNVSIMCPGPIEANSSPTVQYKMTAERCAQLMAIAIANKLSVSIFGKFPILLIVNLALYYPKLYAFLLKKFGVAKLNGIWDKDIHAPMPTYMNELFNCHTNNEQ